jgi:hypothetical protein
VMVSARAFAPTASSPFTALRVGSYFGFDLCISFFAPLLTPKIVFLFLGKRRFISLNTRAVLRVGGLFCLYLPNVFERTRTSLIAPLYGFVLRSARASSVARSNFSARQ